ncbi:hypothetical protein [Duganella sp. HH101]|uniref:hypothetical protein n=1 Tax=Duganella sp. HH101 TaxID=1781066 RepID=UPI0008742F9D|nr:hypothetical protein [Duganella sp. HH101]
MNRLALIATAMILCSASGAYAACGEVRYAYPNQHRPPYWLGEGQAVPDPPGAGVEFAREFAASGNCSLVLVRLPVLRLRTALSSGAVDFAPVDITADGQAGIVIPRDAQGKPDAKRATPIVVVLFVRAQEGINRETDPLDFVRDRQVGMTHGATYGTILQRAGARLDLGSTSASANFEKLRRGRVDAFALSLMTPGDMDKYVETHFHGDIVRLEKPVSRVLVWVGSSQAYYDAHRAQVESMWDWLGSDGTRRYYSILKKYTEQ